MDKNTEEEALVIKCMDEVKSQYVDWYNLGYQTCMAEKKPWVGLTDKEIGGLTVFDGLHHIETPLLAEYIRHIQAKLKEKNG